MKMHETIIARLRNQASTARLVLFSGTGFSFDARDRAGRPIPGIDELRRLLWEILYGADPIEDKATLGELYAVAVRRDPKAVRALLESRLSVDPKSLPDYYLGYFAFPWARAYTLNIDDLAAAASRRFTLSRPPSLISAVRPHVEPEGPRSPSSLEYVHLNGVLQDPPEMLTFAERQYGERLASPDTWYSRFAVDLGSQPVVFVGTELREPPLWQQVALRDRQEKGGRMGPPGAVLVSPTLGRARAEMLQALNIDWFKGTAEDFARDVLPELADGARKGFEFLKVYSEGVQRKNIPLVSELASERPSLETEYLMGDEPHWSDLVQGRAVERATFKDLRKLADSVLSGARANSALAVTGTAGSGKSTALMWLALLLSNEGVPVLWVDRYSSAAPGAIRKRVGEFEGKVVLAIDDADLYGGHLVALLRDLVPARKELLFIIAARSGRIDEIAAPIRRTRDLQLVEYVVPLLTDPDVDLLLAVLDRYNRLGVLKGKSIEERRRAFLEQAGRQLLVAMIQATTGENFEKRAQSEAEQLKGAARYIYALAAVATSQRFALTKAEIMLSASGVQGDAADELQRLFTRHLLVARPPTNMFQTRHRVIAEIVLDYLRERGELRDVLEGLTYSAGSFVDVQDDRRSRNWRLLIRFINHDLLLRLVSLPDARRIYSQLENLLSFDFHYWLQRGSMEVEQGDLRVARQFLDQARSLAPDDLNVETEYGYLLMKRAVHNPEAIDAAALIEEGTRLLEGVISQRNGADYHPYHIIGSQGLAWTRHGVRSVDERRRLLSYYLRVVKEGVDKHPTRRDMQQLRDDLQRELLMTHVH